MRISSGLVAAQRTGQIALALLHTLRRGWLGSTQRPFADPLAPWEGGTALSGFGNTGKDAVVLPGRFNFNLSLFKSIIFKEKRTAAAAPFRKLQHLQPHAIQHHRRSKQGRELRSGHGNLRSTQIAAWRQVHLLRLNGEKKRGAPLRCASFLPILRAVLCPCGSMPYVSAAATLPAPYLP